MKQRLVVAGNSCGATSRTSFLQVQHQSYNPSAREYSSSAAASFFPKCSSRNIYDGGGMIVGTGVDMVEVSRIAGAMERFGERFLARIFTADEIRYCESKRNRVERYAARFAAKEAASKALGTGMHRGVTWQQIEVRREPGGRPTIFFTGAAANVAAKLGAMHAHLSIT